MLLPFLLSSMDLVITEAVILTCSRDCSSHFMHLCNSHPYLRLALTPSTVTIVIGNCNSLLHHHPFVKLVFSYEMLIFSVFFFVLFSCINNRLFFLWWFNFAGLYLHFDYDIAIHTGSSEDFINAVKFIDVSVLYTSCYLFSHSLWKFCTIMNHQVWCHR